MKKSKSPDTKRLDWLTENKGRVLPTRGVWNVWNEKRVNVYDNSLRKALDKAMKAK